MSNPENRIISNIIINGQIIKNAENADAENDAANAANAADEIDAANVLNATNAANVASATNAADADDVDLPPPMPLQLERTGGISRWDERRLADFRLVFDGERYCKIKIIPNN